MSRTIIITGASRGIGLELCKTYQKNGDKVIGVCRTTTAELTALDIELIPQIDLNENKSCSLLKEKLADRQIDILIHCAGILHNESLNDMNFSNIEEQFKTNALAPLKLTHSLRDSLIKGSKVAIITSRMGSIEDNTSGGFYGYRMSKAAVNIAGKSLANDLAPLGVSVGLLHPGFVKTRMTNYNGDCTPHESAQNLFTRIEELNLQNSGSFRHANGQSLPW